MCVLSYHLFIHFIVSCFWFCCCIVDLDLKLALSEEGAIWINFALLLPHHEALQVWCMIAHLCALGTFRRSHGLKDDEVGIPFAVWVPTQSRRWLEAPCADGDSRAVGRVAKPQASAFFRPGAAGTSRTELQHRCSFQRPFSPFVIPPPPLVPKSVLPTQTWALPKTTAWPLSSRFGGICHANALCSLALVRWSLPPKLKGSSPLKVQVNLKRPQCFYSSPVLLLTGEDGALDVPRWWPGVSETLNN